MGKKAKEEAGYPILGTGTPRPNAVFPDMHPPVEKVMDPVLSPAPAVLSFPSFPSPPETSTAEKIQRLQAILRDIQWNGPTVVHVMRRVGTCPECHAYLTHHEECRLNAELKVKEGT